MMVHATLFAASCSFAFYFHPNVHTNEGVKIGMFAGTNNPVLYSVIFHVTAEGTAATYTVSVSAWENVFNNTGNLNEIIAVIEKKPALYQDLNIKCVYF